MHTAFHPPRIGRPVSQPTSHHRQPSSAGVRSRTDPTQPRRKSVEKGTWLAANTKPPFSAPSQTERRNNNKIGRYRAQAQGWACCGRASAVLFRIFPRGAPVLRAAKSECDLDKWHQHTPLLFFSLLASLHAVQYICVSLRPLARPPLPPPCASAV